MSLSISRLTVLSGVLLATLAVAYLAVVNDTSTRGYTLARSRTTLEKLQSDRARLEIDLAAVKNWETLQMKFAELGLSVSGGVSYAHAGASHAARTALAPTTATR